MNNYILIIDNHFDWVNVLDLVGECCPPLLLKCPFKFKTSLSCCILTYLEIFANFCDKRFYYFFLSFACSYSPVLIFFWRTSSSCSCFWRSLFMATYIFWFLAAIQFSFSSLTSTLHLSCILWAYAKLNIKIFTFSV